MIIGTILKNRYKLNNIIGTGGMAHVYDAYDNILERSVAIKVLKDEFIEKEDFLNKFKLEATSAASLSDENIVGIYDVGSEIVNGKRFEYIVMEKIEGLTLSEIISKGPLDEETIVNYAKQIAKALSQAHKKGVVHRDIKPANIIVTSEGILKVTDFGIARVSTQATITYTSSILGTVHYISPEQAKGQPIDYRSDLYSLGVVLYEMATGKVPFDAETPVSIAIKHIQNTAEDITNVISDFNPNLSMIIGKLMEKDVADRYQSAFELMRDLNNYKSNHIIFNDIKKTQKIKKLENKEKNVSSYTSKKIANDIVEEKKKNNTVKYIILFLIALFLGGVIYLMSSIISKGNSEEFAMPNLIDFSEDQALEKLKELGLEGSIKERKFDDQINKDYVIDQSVKPDNKVLKGDRVELTISLGPEMVKVPDLKGFSVESIEKMLNGLGLEVGEITTKKESDQPKDTIITQFPQAGENIKKGGKINIEVSSGKKEELITVPSLIGLDQISAGNTLRSANLILGEVKTENSDREVNSVIDQSIRAGEQVKSASKVDITISIGPKKDQEQDIDVDKDPKIEEKKFNFSVLAPRGKDKFLVEIYNSNKELLFSKQYITKELDNNVASISLIAPSDTKFTINIDGDEADIKYE